MIKPLSDRIIVKLLDEEETKGLWLPEKAKSTLAYGKVVAIGPGRVNADGKQAPMFLKKGDKVAFRPNPGDFAIIDGDEYLTMYEGDILGTL